MSRQKISNREFRQALVSISGLSPPDKKDPLPVPKTQTNSTWARDMIRRLGFVQVDPVSAVERAHHLILFSRNSNYRQSDLERHLEEDRSIFENWTHDAAILPTSFYPYWKHYFLRVANFEPHPSYRRYFAPVKDSDIRKVMRAIKEKGPLKPKDVSSEKADFGDPQFPAPSISKLAMELMWRTGKLAVSERSGRQKVYDLTERVIPKEFREKKVSRAEYIDWVCRESLMRLGAANQNQILHFFDALSKEDIQFWCKKNAKDLEEVEVEYSDGSTSAPLLALSQGLPTWKTTQTPPTDLKLLAPFDPLIHDRKRTLRVFGFDYAMEIYVPPKKRKYGYYVLPILEGATLTGRIDVKVEKKKNTLDVLGLWWEKGIKTTKAREKRLQRALEQLAAFTGVEEVADRS